MVISAMGIPPLQIASTAFIASLAEEARTTGTTPISIIRFFTASAFIPKNHPHLPHASIVSVHFNVRYARHFPSSTGKLLLRLPWSCHRELSSQALRALPRNPRPTADLSRPGNRKLIRRQKNRRRRRDPKFLNFRDAALRKIVHHNSRWRPNR